MIFASQPANFFRAFMDHKAHDATAIVCLPQEIGECVLKEINFYCLTIPIPISACHDINIWDILWVYGSIWFIRCRNHCITPMFPQVKMDHSAMIKHMHSVARISN